MEAVRDCAPFTATAAATLLLMDAWFDIFTARAGDELDWAILAAALGELPLAILCFWLIRRWAFRGRRRSRVARLFHTTNGREQMTTEQQETSVVSQAGQQVQEKAGELKSQAGERLREQVDERSSQAGEQVGAVSQALRSSGEQLRNEGHDTPAKLIDGAAQRVDRSARTCATRTPTGS